MSTSTQPTIQRARSEGRWCPASRTQGPRAPRDKMEAKMRLRNFFAAAAMLVAATSLAGNAQAGPVVADIQAASGLDLQKIHSTCHANIRRHFDPDYGEAVEHLH